MAIQLARAIGMQRKPISPLEGLSDIIAKTGQDIAGQLEKKQEAQVKKAEKEQAFKDAVMANINTKQEEALPQDKEESDRYIEKGMGDLAVLWSNPNTTGMQFKKAADEFQKGLADRNRFYKNTFDVAAKAGGMRNTHELVHWDEYLTGTPDREVPLTEEEKSPIRQKIVSNYPDLQTTQTESEAETPEELKSIESLNKKRKDLEGQRDKELTQLDAATKIVKGEKGYFQKTFEEKQKDDVNDILNKRAYLKIPHAEKAIQGVKGGTWKPEQYVKISTTSKGGVEPERNKDLIRKDRQEYINSFKGNADFGVEHAQTKRAMVETTIRKLHGMGIDENDPDWYKKVDEGVELMAGDAFDAAISSPIEDQMRRFKEERATKGGMTFNFGQGETKKDIYNKEEDYKIDIPAESMYSNITYFDNFEKYKKDNKGELSQQWKKYQGDLKEDEFYRKKYDEALGEQSSTMQGKTKREGWTEKEKESLRKYEGNTAVSFNNKTEENIPLNVTRGGKQVVRQYIPSKILYDKNGNITGVEAYAATKTADENYWKKTDSVEIIPMTKENLNTIKSNFPELLPYIEQNFKVKLKYSEAPTKPAAQKTDEAYQKWRSTLPKDLQNESDYDLKGFYEEHKNNPNELKPNENFHLSDEFKKPNHITFSTGSKYSNDKQKGGQWVGSNKSGWSFEVSPFNLSQHSVKEIKDYFAKYEKDSKLIFPNTVTMEINGQKASVPIDKVDAIKSKYPQAKIY